MKINMSVSGIVAVIIGVVVAAVLMSFLFAFPVKWLWNSTVTELFAWKPIDWWMAWKVMFLCSLLFKSTNVSTKS